jgi:phosphoribosyl-ATP pyrophosphohydrolase
MPARSSGVGFADPMSISRKIWTESAETISAAWPRTANARATATERADLPPAVGPTMTGQGVGTGEVMRGGSMLVIRARSAREERARA